MSDYVEREAALRYIKKSLEREYLTMARVHAWIQQMEHSNGSITDGLLLMIRELSAELASRSIEYTWRDGSLPDCKRVVDTLAAMLPEFQANKGFTDPGPDCKLDDVSIWNRPLTAQEVALEGIEAAKCNEQDVAATVVMGAFELISTSFVADTIDVGQDCKRLRDINDQLDHQVDTEIDEPLPDIRQRPPIPPLLSVRADG